MIERPTVHFISRRENKVAELQQLAPGIMFARADLGVHEVQSINPMEVAEMKGRDAYKKFIAAHPELRGKAIVGIDDTSLGLKAYEQDGFYRPGPFIDFFPNPMILHMLEGIPNRAAVAQTTLGLAYETATGVHVRLYPGIIDCTIALDERGTNGFGWDALVEPVDQPVAGRILTFAEMTTEQKNNCSMRMKAIQLMEADFPNVLADFQ